MLKYNEILTKVKELKVWEKESILKWSDFEIYVFRPEKKFKDYDTSKNFQIFLRLANGREFRPNHLIVMIDLNLRIRSNPNEKGDLLKLFDNIFYKKSFKEDLDKLKAFNFDHFLYDIEIISVLYLLFLIEQDYNYPDKKSNYNPKTLFLHWWVRQFICDWKEIDNLVMSVCKWQPPMAKYTSEDDLNNKKFNKDRKDLWYLN